MAHHLSRFITRCSLFHQIAHKPLTYYAFLPPYTNKYSLLSLEWPSDCYSPNLLNFHHYVQQEVFLESPSQVKLSSVIVPYFYGHVSMTAPADCF